MSAIDGSAPDAEKRAVAIFNQAIVDYVTAWQKGGTDFFNASLELLAGVPAADGKGVYVLNLYRTRLDPPTGMLAASSLVRSGTGSRPA